MTGLRPDLRERLATGDLTPMMKQYLGVKADHPHALVLFRMGDFFETFYDDAEACARLLDLTLTKRSNEKDAAPMAGVPHHAIDGYIARLIELGRTVVLVDQVEDPKKAKGLVRREVTRVITPGTFDDPNAPARVASYLVSLAFENTKKKSSERCALAALDLSTGEFRVTVVESAEGLVDEVLRLGAREVVFSAAAADHALLLFLRQQLPKISFAPVGAENALSRLEGTIGQDEVSALGRLLGPEALEAAGRALVYAEETQLRESSFERKKGGSLAHIGALKPYLPGDALILDAEARSHLELFFANDGGRHGSLLDVIDRAVTAMGSRLVARWLARPLIDLGTIRERQRAVAALVASPTPLDELREALRGVYDLERLIGRVVMGRSHPRDLGALRSSLERVPLVLGAAHAASCPEQGAFDGPRGRLDEISAADPLLDVLEAIRAALVESPPLDFGAARVFNEGYDAELDRLFELSKDGKRILADIEQRERESSGIGSLKIKYNRVFGYFIEVTKANLASVPDRYIRKQTTVNAERYFTEELKEYEDQILHADDKRAERESELFIELVGRVAAEVRRLRHLADQVAELDALGSLAHVAERRGWTRPEVDAGDILEIVDGRHPVLEELGSELGERFVPNDVTLGRDKTLLIITGPNMAGKSTIMRQTALSVILGQMGSFLPAARAQIGVVDRVFTRVGAGDDLSKGRSTFMVEMSEASRILRSATSRSLILLDEIGRGTSTFDGLSIAWAIAEHLHDVVGARTLFATHYHELTELCRDRERATNFHVAVKQWKDEIVFLRKLLPGATNRSYGVQVARLAGLPKVVVDRANEVLASLESQDLARGAHRGQLSLFAGDRGPALTPLQAEVLDAIQSMSPDDTTPRQALQRIIEWQARLKSDT